MMEQYNQTATLYLVPTPIGNMEDMTFRAIRILQEVSYIFAEDTRVTKRLLSHFHITYQNLNSYHVHNEADQVNHIIHLLQAGNDVALCSDAGMPGISDPGYLVVKQAIQNQIKVVALPGASAVTTALVASGLTSNRFVFLGFLDAKTTKKRQQLQEWVDYKETLIFYEAPHRIQATLQILYEVYGDREVVIAREITKRYEEYIRFSLAEQNTVDFELKGELVILVQGAKEKATAISLKELSIEEHIAFYSLQNINEKEALKKVAKDRGVSKSEIYQHIHKK